MRRQYRSAALIGAALLVLGSPNTAAQGLLNLSAGQVGIDRALDNRGRYGIEYRFAATGRYRLVPALGVVGTANHAKYLYAAVHRTFFLGSQWYLTPGIGIVGFDSSDELDLGLAMEFRSGLELGYRFANQVHLGLALYHLSNASLGDENPGTEEIVVSLSFPLP